MIVILESYKKFNVPKDYKNLGWQKHSGNCKEISKCISLNHNIETFDNSFNKNRCTVPKGTSNKTRIKT